MPSRIKGLYAITPDQLDTQTLLTQCRQALAGGVQVLQYRNKLASAELCLEQALALRELTAEFQVPLIINDSVSLTQQVAADGVHLGADDGSIQAARNILGCEKIIGASCYNRLDLAQQAITYGASYIAFGSCFASSVKPNAPVANIDLIKQARNQFPLPIVCIGGINLYNAEQLLEIGVNALAVISAIFAANDIQNTAQQFATLNYPNHLV